ncbi:MAG: HAD-IC family P-type ATPase [Ruminiclostridium sp.]|nr:HAD-IC family P-type ATPase [Ruminiclostridium sp.]
MPENKTDINNGLSEKDVATRVEKGLINGDFNIPSKSIKQIFKDNCLTFFNFLNVILALFIVLVAIMEGNIAELKNCLFLGVILCNTAIGIFQEIRSKKAVDKLALISAPKAKVLRSGKEETVAVKDIVMDDLMILGAGNQVCSDCIVLQGECEVNESLITGESDPIIKKEGDEILSGSFVICGDVRAQVIRIGADNYANKITSGAKYIKKNKSEMLGSINYVLKIIGICIIPMILLMFGKEMLLSKSTLPDAIVSTVSSIIGMIPEGLVLMASMVLAVSVIRLATRKTLAQDLYCVETLARVDVLCLDKTGTITEGSMEVTDIISLDGKNYDDALTALMNALHDHNPTYEAVKEKYSGTTDWETVSAIPFSSAKKWSLASFKGKGTYIMGAAEFILKHRLTEELKKLIEEQSTGGYRIILIAHSENEPDMENKDLPDCITPVALIKISDKIRKEAPDTLEFFAKQGVDIRIISGDNPVTVSGVAKRAGLVHYDSYIDASTLTTDEEIHEAAKKYKIFGRVTPYQKLELVKALKSEGHTVAMTGDGVNDVLALKESDCSIAMQSGSDAARNVSNIVLLDSNFASMPHIVAEGRRSINNIERSGVLFLSKTVYSFLAALLFCFIPFGYPLQAIQLTVINVFTNGIPSFLLALEPNFDIVRGKFIENVLPKSIIYGLVVAINFIGVVIARYITTSTGIIPQAVFDPQIETLTMLTMAFAAFVILFKVCMPLKAWKIGLLGFLIGGFALATFILKDFLLDLQPLCFEMIIILAILMAISLGYGIVSQLYEKKWIAFILSLQKKAGQLLDKLFGKKAGKETN